MKPSAVLVVALLAAATFVSAPAYVAAKEKSVTVVGEIVRYEPGHVIVLRDAANTEVTYTLTPSITIPTGVEVGKRVTLYTTRGDDGSTTVTRVSTSVTTGHLRDQRADPRARRPGHRAHDRAPAGVGDRRQPGRRSHHVQEVKMLGFN